MAETKRTRPITQAEADTGLESNPSASRVTVYPARKPESKLVAWFVRQVEDAEMKRKIALALMLVLMLLMLVPFEALAQETVATLDSAASFYYPLERKSFYANGLLWVIYGKTTSIYYKTSADKGQTWSAPVVLRANSSIGTGDIISVHFDGVYAHFMIKDASSPYVDYYRRGIPESNGTFTWSTVAWQDTGFVVGSDFSVGVSSTGYPFITWLGWVAGVGTRIQVSKSSTNDGTWATAAGFPYTLGDGWGNIIPLTDNKMVGLYASAAMKAKRWTGSAWGSLASGTSSIVLNGYSAVAQDDDVHIVFLKDATHDIVYTKYSYSTNSFSAEATLYSAATSTSYPVIQRLTENNDLIVYWENKPTDDHVYWLWYKNDESTWYGPYDWIAEVDGLPANGYYLNSDYTATTETAGLYYIAGATTLKWKQLQLPWAVLTLDPSGVTLAAATIRGNIISTGSGTIAWKGFYFGPDPTLATYTAYGEAGTFGVGVYSQTVTGLNPDSLYYYKAHVEDSYGSVVEGNITAFMTLQPSYIGDDITDYTDLLTAPIPTTAPGGWIRTGKDYNGFPIIAPLINTFADLGFGRSFFWFIVEVFAIIVLTLAGAKFTKNVPLTFAGLLLLFLLPFIAFEYLDWWMLAPYLLVGAALCIKEGQFSWS